MTIHPLNTSLLPPERMNNLVRRHHILKYTKLHWVQKRVSAGSTLIRLLTLLKNLKKRAIWCFLSSKWNIVPNYRLSSLSLV